MKTRSNAGYALIMAVIMITVFALLGLTGMLMVGTEKHMELDAIDEAQALYLAESGIQYMALQLKNDSDWSDNNNLSNRPALGGTFDVEYLSQSKDAVELRVAGEMGNARRKIKISFVRSASSVYGDALTLKGESSLSGSKTTLTIEGTIVENGSEFAEPNYAYLESIADSVIHSSTKFKKNHTYNGIYYVKGDVTIQRDVIINGAVIAEGTISISGNGDSVITAPTNMPALVATGNIQISGNVGLDVYGIVYAGGDVNISSSGTAVTIHGALAAQGDLQCSGNSETTIFYDAAYTGPAGFTGVAGSITTQDWEETG